MKAEDIRISVQTSGGKRIGTARDHVAALRNHQAKSLLDLCAAWAVSQGYKFDINANSNVKAEVNHGHWIVKCPFCEGAEEADPQDPFFYCMSCGNTDNEGKVIRVAFPADRDAIEALLLKRPMANRNWLPTETVLDLMRENQEHGLGDGDH